MNPFSKMSTRELIEQLGAGWGNGDRVCEAAAERLEAIIQTWEREEGLIRDGMRTSIAAVEAVIYGRRG